MVLWKSRQLQKHSQSVCPQNKLFCRHMYSLHIVNPNPIACSQQYIPEKVTVRKPPMCLRAHKLLKTLMLFPADTRTCIWGSYARLRENGHSLAVICFELQHIKSWFHSTGKWRQGDSHLTVGKVLPAHSAWQWQNTYSATRSLYSDRLADSAVEAWQNSSCKNGRKVKICMVSTFKAQQTKLFHSLEQWRRILQTACVPQGSKKQKTFSWSILYWDTVNLSG